jgi:hypothetical protein
VNSFVLLVMLNQIRNRKEIAMVFSKLHSEPVEVIQKTRDYLDYIQEHYYNVQRAWEEIKKKCFDMVFVSDDYLRGWLDVEVIDHDISKLSNQEFIQYRRRFFPTNAEKELKSDQSKHDFKLAWASHQFHNDHHWQTWTEENSEVRTSTNMVNCVHMVVDWTAMGYKFNDTPREYYEENKDSIHLPEWAVQLVYDIFARLEVEVEEGLNE